MKRKKPQDMTHYEILNLPFTVSEREVEEAYLQLTYVYGDSSMAWYGALADEERRWMLNRIQRACETLRKEQTRREYDEKELGLSEQEKEKLDMEKTHELKAIRLMDAPAKAQPPSGGAERDRSRKKNAAPASIPARVTGSHLRNIRNARGASLDEIAQITKVKKSYLEAIENEDIKSFPAPIFMKGFLKAYAKALGLDPEEISDRYLAKAPPGRD
ncbi:MAG: helix-turn-helix domain-containing protein [Candidatus Nitrospinota bacterium M3_3B_026]